MKAINPASEQVIREYPQLTQQQLSERLDDARRASLSWKQTPIEQRAAMVGRAAGVLRQRALEFSRLMTAEMGKPIAQSEAEIEKCAICCEHLAQHGPRYLSQQNIATDADQSYVRYDPLGAVLAIMPWNFPFWQVIRFAAPALVAGNVGILKHAPNVPGCALAIERVFLDAGLPPGVFTTLLVDVDATGRLISDPLIAAVTLTGSERAGMSVAAKAGAALKKTVLELGGSDPFIVLDDADLAKTAQAAASARCINSGQSCIAAKRFIVVGNATAFAAELARIMGAMKVGDPMDRSVEIGPLARLDLLENLQAQVDRSIAAGAKLVVGGKRLARKGFFFAPTVLADVRPGMPAFDEETFGPVAAVIEARDTDHAIELANLSRYGLGASIWTADLQLAQRLVSRIDSGSVFINGPVKSDPRLPFGGVKHSGYGRELSAHGIQEFVNIKTVWIKASPQNAPGLPSE